jgi:hypothetical protein
VSGAEESAQRELAAASTKNETTLKRPAVNARSCNRGPKAATAGDEEPLSLLLLGLLRHVGYS